MFSVSQTLLLCRAVLCTFPHLNCGFCSTADVPRLSSQSSIWSRSEQFEAVSQSELLIAVALMSVLQLPRRGSALVPSSRTENGRKLPTQVPFAFASCAFLINQLASLAAHAELDSAKERKRRQVGQKKCPCYAIKLLSLQVKASVRAHAFPFNESFVTFR